VVFGLNRPSIYAKGQVVPSKETLLHSGIYEALPEINAIICVPGHIVLETAEKLSLPSTILEQSAGSQELAQEAVNLMKLNQSVRCFVIKNYCVVALGATMSEAGKQMEAIQTRAESWVKLKPGRKKPSG
jgi:ribulose-5-phosphate 4-epimerase/fuculose-1-phosphate aldolase